MRPYLRLFVFFSVIILATGCKKNNSIPASLSVSPTTDTIGGIITITGSGFSSNLTDNLVMFNDTSYGTVLSATSTQLTVSVPGYATEGRITIKTRSGMEAQTAQVFTVVPKFWPTAESAGYPINIQTGGGSNIADYTVSFNGKAAKPTSIYGSLLVVTVPSGASNGKITVNYKGKPYTSLTDFTITPVGTVTTITGVGAFVLATGLAIDSSGNIFVCDLEGGLIYKVDVSSGAVSTYAGNGSYNSNGGSPLLSAGVYGSGNLAFAPDGVMYTTDSWYGYIMKIWSDSVVNLYPTGAGFSSTAGIYIDMTSNIYLTDSKSIKKISADGTISVIAGQQQLQGFQNGPVSSALFSNPTSLTLDASGNIYVADVSEVRLISNGYVSTFAGGGGNGQYTDGTGSNAGFLGVSSIVLDPASGNIFVADPGSHLVRMVSPAGVVTTIAGDPGQSGHTDGIGISAQFDSGPTAITMDKSGNIYVTDGAYGTGTIRKIVLH